MSLRRFLVANYAIAIVPQRRPFRYRFLANLSLPFLGTGDAGGQFTDDAENAVIINRRNVAARVDLDAPRYGLRDYQYEGV